MGKTIKARFTKGAFEPLEKVDMPEGKEVTITILEIPARRVSDGLERSAGGWKDLVDTEALKRNIYANRLLATRPEPKL